MYTLWTDVETTGIRIGVHEVIQIAMLVEDEKSNVIDSIFLCMRPDHVEHCDAEALSKMQITIEDLIAYPDRKSQIEKAMNFLRKHFEQSNGRQMLMAGYNVSFDKLFVQHMFDEVQKDWWRKIFLYEVVDVLPMTWMARASGLFISKDVKLETICQTLNISVNTQNTQQFHNAMYDIRCTRKLMYTLMLLERQKFLSEIKNEH